LANESTDMNWSLDFSPMVPTPLLWAAAAVAVLLVVALLVRRSRGALWRAAALGALLAALTNPTLREEERETLANIALVVVDESTSQTLAKRPEQARAIREALADRLGKIDNLEINWVTAAKPGEAGGQGTQLFAELNRALTETPPDRIAGVILVTDGQIHDVPKSAAALGFDAPVHTLLTGTPREFDRRIEVLTAPRYGLVGQSRDVEVAVREVGPSGGRSDVSLRIRREGRPDELRRVEIGKTVTIEMPIPHGGTNILEIELETATGELTPANNRQVVITEGVRENLRVLLVSGEPHAGERTWRNLLKSDAAVDLVHFTILRPPEKQDGTPINQLSLIAFPTKELFSDKIKDFDLIIFDRYEHRGILQMLYYDNISRYVDNHGGAILVAAGDDYAGRRSLYRTPLSPVLPAAPTGRVLETPFRAKITAEGAKHPVTQSLPGANGPKPGQAPTWGRWYRQAEVRPGRGHVVMEGAEKKPLLVLDRKGKGRVALLTSDHAWLWARGYEGGGPHTDLLRRLSHWLMKEPDLEEERLIATAHGLKVKLDRRSLETSVAPVSLLGPGGEKTDVTLKADGPGLWTSSVEVKVPGLYKAETAGPEDMLTAVVHAGVVDPREMSEVTATGDKLKPIVEATGGGTFWTRTSPSAAPDDVTLPRVSMLGSAKVFSGSGWMGLRDREAFVTRGVKLTPLFSGLLALAFLLALMAAAWWREGR
jgi:hypothetical protein